MRCTNKKLMMAMTTAAWFSLPLSGVYAAGQFINVTDVANVTGAGSGVALSAFNDYETTPTSPTDVVASTAEGILYAQEIFSGGASPSTLPSDKSAAVVYTTDGPISSSFQMTFSIVDNAATIAPDGFFAQSGNAVIDSLNDQSSGTTVRYEVSLGSGAGSLPDGANFLFVYKLNQAGILEDTNKDIKMKVEVKSTGLSGNIVNPTRTVTVAKSVKAVTMALSAENEGEAKISVTSGSTEFSGDGSGVNVAGSRTAQIGFLELQDADATTAVESDGETAFEIGGGTGNDGEITSATLTIKDGQFAASVGNPGRVFLDSTTAEADQIEVSDDGQSATATFNLTAAQLRSIVLASEAASNNKVGIRFTVDGSTEINIPENAPCAYLSIDFKESYVKDIEMTEDQCVPLRKIRKDGTTCWVYIVPKSAVRDSFSMNITNNTNNSDTIKATLYPQGGGEPLFSGLDLVDVKGNTVLEPMKTIRVDTNALIGMNGGNDWVGRAWVELETVLSDIQVVTTILDLPSNITANISQGASGEACTN